MQPINDRFIWDEDKYDTNVKKHGITFVEAMAVFDDPNGTRGRFFRLTHIEYDKRTVSLSCSVLLSRYFF